MWETVRFHSTIVRPRYFMSVSNCMDFLGSSVVKNPPANTGDAGSIPGLPLEKELASHSKILAWEISWTEDRVGLQSRV